MTTPTPSSESEANLARSASDGVVMTPATGETGGRSQAQPSALGTVDSEPSPEPGGDADTTDVRRLGDSRSGGPPSLGDQSVGDQPVGGQAVGGQSVGDRSGSREGGNRQGEGRWAWLARPGPVIALIAAYIALHLGIRFLISPTLGIDDAQQALFGQELLLGYRFREPPLITWSVWAGFQLLGETLLALSLTVYLYLFAGYVFLYLAARRICRDDRLAALSLASFGLIYVFAYYVHHDLTHTVAVGTLIAASLYLLIRAVESQRPIDFAMLGVALGLGLLAKYNFGLFILCAALAGAAVPEIRRRLYTRTGAVAAATMAVVIAPYTLWVVIHEYSFTALGGHVMQAEGVGAGIDWSARVAALGSLALAVVEFPLPLLVLLPLVLPGVLRRRAVAHPAAAVPWRRFLALHMVFGIGLLAVAAVAFGASEFKGRWFHPILMVLPILVFARVSMADLPRRRVAAFLGLVAGVTGFVMVARLVVDSVAPHECGRCRAYLPTADLAYQLREAGFARGTILTSDHHLGGNLHLQFPDSRVLAADYPLHAQSREPVADQCLVVWRAGGPGPGQHPPDQGMPPDLHAYLTGPLQAHDGPDAAVGTVDAGLIGAPYRRVTLAYSLIPGGVGTCR